MIRSVIAATVFLGGMTVLLAQSDQITERQALMKSNAKNAKNVTQMVKGESPFDAAAATAAFNTWHENAKKIPTLFTAPPPADADGIRSSRPSAAAGRHRSFVAQNRPRADR